MAHDDGIANRVDYAEVAIYFEDEDINHLFAELLEVRGVRTHILADISEFSGDTKLVTEPQFFERLDARHRSKCLLVGNRQALQGMPALSLVRPLTEEKVESAITKLLEI